ncbi:MULTISPECIES: porin [unclassified Prochlorococcus]|uniref:porin n=1 Tax=unclassified Prochlorococcus TaxID=2627481 RepID=UPI00097CC5D7|nr:MULTISPECIES: porin [unclassified Prochlorococcus]AQL31313.1 porin [Prochlorococcus sp. RS50]AQL31746.1 porin [Prochlorococcus sp. RS01]AQL34698.1 porin [Prochlorococcus sp. RS04]
MKLFKSLLVAPATLGLLAPMTASANEVTINDFNAAEEIAVTNSRVDGLEARFNNLEAGSFSETTTASFGVDFLVGAVDGGTSEKTEFAYQMGIGLETSFTGEDALSATIDIGNASATSSLSGTSGMNFDGTTDALKLDGLTYTFPVGGATVMVGDNTDVSAVYTGACAYNAFTDFMGNCGTGNSVGLGGKGVTAAMSYAFDGGFSLAGGLSSDPSGIMAKAENDAFGIEAAYTADSYGIAVAYSDVEGTTDTTYWGVNGMYAFDFATISAGVESEDPVGGSTKTGFFVGLSFPEVGAGTFDIGLATSANYASSETEYYTYEASYSYPINDGMTITPGVFIQEGTTDKTGFAVKTSFSF